MDEQLMCVVCERYPAQEHSVTCCRAHEARRQREQQEAAALRDAPGGSPGANDGGATRSVRVTTAMTSAARYRAQGAVPTRPAMGSEYR